MFYFNKNFGLFVGRLTDNKFHKHYAIQISLSLSAALELSVKNEQKSIVGNAFFISSNTEHKLWCDDIQLTILINPLCSTGQHLSQMFGCPCFQTVHNPLQAKLNKSLKSLIGKESSFENFCLNITETLNQNKNEYHVKINLKDDRIMKALAIMEGNFEKVYSLEEISSLCYLSPSRFLHLFKETTEINFRRYQLWNRLIKSMPFLKNNSITETAHICGFSDSSHYTRTFKETFGVNPKFLQQ
ncbi:AraC family transcriptional regulator [Cytophagaceae bacterium ABcell3]|nr:AraC family transcriptional regulator [Cytophagaceae bacterium ABcell3]